MGKLTAYQEIKEALEAAIISSDEPFVVSSLDELHDPFEICQITEKQLRDIMKMKRSITINARYHQGRALKKKGGSQKNLQNELKLESHQRRIAENVYYLFKEHEYLLPVYFGRDDAFNKVDNKHLRQLREVLNKLSEGPSDPINQDLADLLTFDDEGVISFPPTDEDVMPTQECDGNGDQQFL